MAAPKYNCVLLSISLFMLLNLFIPTKATPTYTAAYCTNTTFDSRDDRIWDPSKDVYGHFFSGPNRGTSTSKAIKGLILCRGDVTATVCNQCLTAAVKEIRIRCPNQPAALIWYDECFLRYTNKYFDVDNIIPIVNLDDGNIDSGIDLGRFNQSLYGLLNRLITEAAAAAKKFAAAEAVVTEWRKVHGLMQCTDDLTKSECEKCLRNAIGTLPNGKQGARALLPFCNIRYQLYPFFNLSSPPQSSVPPLKEGRRNSTKNIKEISIMDLGDKKLERSGTIAAAVVLSIVFLIILFWRCYDFKRRSKKRVMASLMEKFEDEIPALESLQFNLATLEAATNQFSLQNKIGSGGFGEVYKGVLPDGRQIAVKKLSKYSGQGTIEFKNEIMLIAKLQHRNLVTLYGFCSEEQEKMVVYEYVANKSLDSFLFDPNKRRVLSWHERYRIIGGIARGIHYLHDQSRLKVIHRDLKPSNILLDEMMNPKISDFGMAKKIDINQHQGNTIRIVGTYGYMPSEYAMHGNYSEKSDVFSFGVIILEIISSKRNARSLGSPDFNDLLSYAWKNWKDETQLEVLDSDIEKSFCHSEVIKCIQIGLLCVQQNPFDRPTMERIVSYLSSVSAELPLPQEPAGFMANGTNPSMIPRINNSSVNHMTMSLTLPR